LIGKEIESVFPDLSEVIQKAYEKPDKIAQQEISFKGDEGQQRILNVRIAVETINDKNHGAVVTFDDITELQSAQRKAAWADVARRIAHEIKNPLTPIQLSAERLKRKYLGQIEQDPDTFEVCTDTIIRHVDDIGRMVNEFSDFARMPEAIMREVAIVKELKEILVFQDAANSHIKINIHDKTDPSLVVRCDAQQIRQAVTNLIQNAVDSVDEKMKSDSSIKGQIDVLFATEKGQLMLVITDNGLGFNQEQKEQDLTEPYVTYKAKGTGLGLAIVKKIMSDHDGALQIGDNKNIRHLKGWKDLGGATVALMLPINQMPEEMKKSA
ncbi:MAG: ATP-binding protein, partial [Pseudomonadota bacterium]